MSDSPRKTLGLPAKPRSDAPETSSRKPVRGAAPTARSSRSVPPRPVSGAQNVPQNKSERAAQADGYTFQAKSTETAEGSKPRVRIVKQEKPRGTPSRAPVVPKATGAVLRSPTPESDNKIPQSGVRISKLMAERGLCSRREADAFIERGWVFVDGERVTELGTRAAPDAKIKLDKGAQAAQRQQMTILMHKPVGYVSGQPEPGFKPAVTLVQPETQYKTPDTPAFHPMYLKGLAPAGRLDIDSTGLLVLTQDGRVARQLIGEDSTVDKEYLVRVEGRLDAKGLALLNHGLSLDGHTLKPAKVEWLNEDQLRFVLNEGRKRQIRRMCELVGLHVVGLKRVRIGRVLLGDLPLGQWRFLRESESF
ncbi:MAG: pseudouridine synthase [Propionivibrio sp.]|nr:pseudouridine synthase [Propionivibrio sp.]MBP6709761.1 pseudouridine synthase [Propionivibrio sp.]MBP7524589.1 pseudouridine synthase [Propionivibrio sp.]